MTYRVLLMAIAELIISVSVHFQVKYQILIVLTGIVLLCTIQITLYSTEIQSKNAPYSTVQGCPSLYCSVEECGQCSFQKWRLDTYTHCLPFTCNPDYQSTYLPSLIAPPHSRNTQHLLIGQTLNLYATIPSITIYPIKHNQSHQSQNLIKSLIFLHDIPLFFIFDAGKK